MNNANAPTPKNGNDRAVEPVHRCVCGRVLTDPRSVARGYGRACQRRMAAAFTRIGATWQPRQITAATQLIDDGGLIVGPGGTCLATSTDGSTVYVVDPTAGTCTCMAGQNGRRCYHLAAATAMVAPAVVAVAA